MRNIISFLYLGDLIFIGFNLKMKFNPEINRLRGIAIMLVMYEHIGFGGHIWNFLRNYFWGNSGVDLFFVISGFVISGSFYDSLDKHNDWHVALKEFWIKRVSRILPTAIVWIFISLLLAYSIRNITKSFDLDIIGSIAALFNVYNIFAILAPKFTIFGSYWSLSLEEQFYLIFPFLLIFVRNIKIRMAIFAIIMITLNIFSPAVRIYVRPEGMIFGAIWYNVWKTLKLKHISFGKTHGPIIALFLIIVLSSINATFLQGPFEIKQLIVCFISVILLAFTSLRMGLFPDIKYISTLLDWLAKRSYALYLTHVPILNVNGYAYQYWYKTEGHSKVLVRDGGVLIATLLAILLAELSYRYIEEPFRKLGRNYAVKLIRVQPQHERPLFPIEAASNLWVD